jgi:hypothetical protein
MTDQKRTTDIMAAIQAQVSAQDAAQDAILASIMEGKYVAPRKVQAEPKEGAAPAKKTAAKPRKKKAAKAQS